MNEPRIYRAIGLMSGSSLDGLDIAYCVFTYRNDFWTFAIEQAECVSYTTEWIDKLRNARELLGTALWELHAAFGHLLASETNQFIKKKDLTNKVDIIGSHGHTIFHFPDRGFTTQIGDGAALAAHTGITVACDFRTTDIALGGQGTPIVPIGDSLLFSHYPCLLNVGGIANISIKSSTGIIAFDICAANQVLNHYAGQKGHEYDPGGSMAAMGRADSALLRELNSLSYYAASAPKSLDNGFSQQLIPIIDRYGICIEDKLATYTEHIAMQVCLQIERLETNFKTGQMLITGGGAFNTHLIDRIKANTKMEIVIPGDELVKYKEAMVIAFMSVLRLRTETNVLSSVTGSKRSSIGGALYV